ncbi:class I lanthipeptide [Acidobacteriota bacterium]
MIRLWVRHFRKTLKSLEVKIMKTKKFSKKLVLNKTTLSRLDDQTMEKARGGIITFDEPFCAPFSVFICTLHFCWACSIPDWMCEK